MSISPDSICANKNDRVIFTCSATGGPGNMFRWEDASSGELLTDEEVLTVDATKTQEYICTVENEAGSDSSTATLFRKSIQLLRSQNIKIELHTESNNILIFVLHV